MYVSINYGAPNRNITLFDMLSEFADLVKALSLEF